MKNIFKRIGITILIILVFKLGKTIIIPGVNPTLIKLSLSTGNFLNIMSMVSGGSLSSFSIFALGVGPYISASIIIQLSATFIPYLKKLREEGQKGRSKINRITRYASVIIAIFQALALVLMFNKDYNILENSTTLGYISVIVCLIAGMSITMWLADIITVYGIGNGVSILIFIGIISSMPNNFKVVYNTLISLNHGYLYFVLYCMMFVLMVIGIILLNTSERRIPIQQSHRVVNKAKGDFNYIPFKPNSASVTPVIFASAFLTVPPIVASFFTSNLDTINNFFSLTSISGIVMYSILIICFTFFYTNLEIDIKHITENFENNGTYIPGIRPGLETRKYLSHVLNSITWLGAIGLVIISILPSIIAMQTGMSSSIIIGGNSIIIAVDVSLEIAKNLKTMIEKNEYEHYRGF